MGYKLPQLLKSLRYHKLSLRLGWFEVFYQKKTILLQFTSLPEVPPDTAETNPLLRLNSIPQFSQISPDKVVTGCAKAAIQYEVAVDDHITALQGKRLTNSVTGGGWGGGGGGGVDL